MNDTQGIAAIGECMLELSASDDDQWRMGFAGDTFNTLWCMRALLADMRVEYVTAFGDDPFSRRQTRFLYDNGIGTANSSVIPGARPGLYAITLDGIERSFTYWRADAAARQLANDPGSLAKSLSNLRLAYFSGITLAILNETDRKTLLSALENARAGGTLIAFDPNYRPRLWPAPDAARRGIDDALRISDIVLPTFADEQELFGDSSPDQTLDRLAGAGVGEAVVKNGTDDALVLFEGATRSVPALRIEDAVDTTGAGDAFNGGYLAARMIGLNGSDSTRKAHRTAAAAVRVQGALAPFDILREAFEG